MKLAISEILERVDAAPNETAKIKLLRENGEQAVKDVLQGAFDSRIKWLLPEGPVPYKPTEAIDQEGNLYTETRRLYLFVEGGDNKIPQSKREHLFIQLLEYVCPKDAKLLEAVKDKKLPYVTITPDLVQKAFPEMGLQVAAEPKKAAVEPPVAVEPAPKVRKKPGRKIGPQPNRKVPHQIAGKFVSDAVWEAHQAKLAEEARIAAQVQDKIDNEFSPKTASVDIPEDIPPFLKAEEDGKVEPPQSV